MLVSEQKNATNVFKTCIDLIAMNAFLRYQKGMVLADFYPSQDGYCACGCGRKLTGRQTRWASRECNDRAYEEFAILKGGTSTVRKALFERDLGFCHNCGVYDENWEADHIIPVSQGGGACGLDNYQTLCPDCHKEKTKNQRESQSKEYSLHAFSSDATVLL